MSATVNSAFEHGVPSEAIMAFVDGLMWYGYSPRQAASEAGLDPDLAFEYLRSPQMQRAALHVANVANSAWLETALARPGSRWLASLRRGGLLHRTRRKATK